MNIIEYPQFHLYLLTLHLVMIKEMLIPKNSNERWAYGTIINRAYYSRYHYCQLWLEKAHRFKVKHPWEFEEGERIIGEHAQVREALWDFGKEDIKTALEKLAKLRKKADYRPYNKIKKEDVDEAIGHVKYIFNNLKFD